MGHEFDPLPFEYEGRYADHHRSLGFDLEQATVLEQRDKDLEDYLAAAVTPLVFHWHGEVADHIDVRNGPGEFGRNGALWRIRYRWDTPAAAGATVEWRLDDVVVFTHTVSSANPHIELPGHPYRQESIVAVVTDVATDGQGLSAFVYL